MLEILEIEMLETLSKIILKHLFLTLEWQKISSIRNIKNAS